ncbi:hypothetical protein GMRT_12496 [Giardia muris]|uniref:Uncharacterized protein n=1 Tax=Giardia muris TaxID=5742 RepID=A0A4Z1SQ27_GIAMU|nr:hypothetical protein GMRT_12496 [Giardia muris]|eukprot:TNJ27934.1 hypothetical protein GMRT_12496 [Giardia muris]
MSNYLQTIQHASVNCRQHLAGSDYGRYLLSQARLYEQIDNIITLLQIPPSAPPAAVAAILPQTPVGAVPSMGPGGGSPRLSQYRQTARAPGVGMSQARSAIPSLPNEARLFGDYINRSMGR